MANSSAPGTGFEEYIGRREVRSDVVTARSVERLAATLGSSIADAAMLPPLWHWMLFQEWAPPQQVGTDGHAKRGGFLPPIVDLPRRVWAGGRVNFHTNIALNSCMTRTSTILSVKEKIGASGRLLLVTVGHEMTDERGLAISEEQDLIYRGSDNPAVRLAEGSAPAPAGSFFREVQPDPVLLFRFSSLTGNGHRIHYDLDYAKNEEGYPGLVVHGPLQAILLADLLLRQHTDSQLSHFAFRAQRTAIVGVPLVLEGWSEGPIFRLRTRDTVGAVCMSAEATLR
jgi:3-methylfumaryl-CoA hydratase